MGTKLGGPHLRPAKPGTPARSRRERVELQESEARRWSEEFFLVLVPPFWWIVNWNENEDRSLVGPIPIRATHVAFHVLVGH